MTGLFPVFVFDGEAACREPMVDPNWFFPPDGRTAFAFASHAKKVCRRCPLEADCLEYAVSTGEEFGIWGGTSAQQRQRIRNRRVLV